MKLITIVLSLLSPFATFAADDAKPSGAATKPPLQAEMLKMAGPGPEHEQLAGYAGNWDVEIKMGGGRNAMAYQGSARNRITVRGRFLEMQYEATGKGGTNEGIFTLGFDRRHKEYALVALDSFGTYFVTSQGKRDEKTGKIKMYGKDNDPQMKAMGLTKEFVHVLDLRSADEYAVEVWFVDTRTAERREMKFMEYTFKRKK
ncbi:MAG TPA: DUF1579 family protein [Methylomirabilota bacterium]|nr:DUF1579 family protein [Methylomirabilota bacterium]